MKIFHCFDRLVWLCIICTEAVTMLFCRTLYFQSWINVFAIFRSQPTTHTQRFYLRYLFLTYVICSLIINSVFQGNLVKSFGTIQNFHDMNTLQEFAQSDFVLYTTYEDIFNYIDNDVFKELKAKVAPFTPEDYKSTLNRSLGIKNRATLERRTDAKYVIMNYFLDETGYPRLHVINECPRTFFVAYAVQKGSPYVGEFSKIITMLKEAGFISKWNSISKVLFLKRNIINDIMDDEAAVPINLYDLIVAFYVLSLGLILSIFVFLLEVLWYKICGDLSISLNRKKPHRYPKKQRNLR
ncbi:uncharacterized protein LOC126888314 [Diabrotica virgifera virgifera]|uniref:Uncharacterized protein n=1 Tax=Diabrotica virgifera virgifera TaxID=50390 RepID=A0ABM5KQE0_DIAVI|nr:uncharacterized protein LOC126888314 [Diabrotica virgifera virgifera]